MSDESFGESIRALLGKAFSVADQQRAAALEDLELMMDVLTLTQEARARIREYATPARLYHSHLIPLVIKRALQ